MSVDQLIAASAELDERTRGLSGQLALVTARANSESGVEITVNLDGMIVAIDLTTDALRLGPDRLAAEIFRLTRQAAGAALAAGIIILEPVAGADLMSLLTPDEAEPAIGHADEDFSVIETWALPN
jgi:hypothetical protein